MTDEEKIKTYLQSLQDSGQIDESGKSTTAADDADNATDYSDSLDNAAIDDLGNPSDLPDFMDQSSNSDSIVQKDRLNAINNPSAYDYTKDKRLTASNDPSTMTDADPVVRTDLNSYPYTKAEAGGPDILDHDYNKDVSDLMPDYLGRGADANNPKLFTSFYNAIGKDQPKFIKSTPVTGSDLVYPEQSGSGKASLMGRSRFNVPDFVMPEGGYTPSGKFEEPDTTKTAADEDKDANRQRLLAYLGMGAQDAITGMTGFKGNTNVYDQMLLAQKQKDKNAITNKARINDYLRQKNAFTLGEEKLAQNDMFSNRKMALDAWKIKNQLEGKADQSDKVLAGKLQAIGGKPGEGIKTVDRKTAAMWTESGQNGHNEAGRDALRDFKSLAADLKNNPKYQPSRLNNFLSSLGRISMNESAMQFPEFAEARQTIERGVLPSLRRIFSSQFTEGEGLRLFNTVFNERLSPEANIKALNSWITSMGASINEQDRILTYYQDHNMSMAGFPRVRKHGTIQKMDAK